MKLRTLTAMSLATALLGLTAGLALALHPQAVLDKGGVHLNVSRGEPQPGDDRGRGRGRDDVARENQPGDDHGGRGRGHDDVAKGEPQPGDDRGRGGHGRDDRA